MFVRVDEASASETHLVMLGLWFPGLIAGWSKNMIRYPNFLADPPLDAAPLGPGGGIELADRKSVV